MLGRRTKSDARERKSFYPHYYKKYVQPFNYAADKADRARLTQAYQTAAILFKFLKAICPMEVVDVVDKDDTINITRFLVLAKGPIIPGTDKPFKTSIVFTLEEGPGMLFKTLSVFALERLM